tara:strand:+ start:1043 stop:2272 length:1230 start_codon:yes stop_codon:yes gene_type:complete
MTTKISATGIDFPDGDAANPSMGGTDTNTGLFYGTDIVAVTTGGTERLRITSGGDVSILNDSGKFTCGTGNDLQLYHDGTNSRITNATGQLSIAGDTVAITNGAVSENLAKFTADGAVELYFNNAKKLETATNGGVLRGTQWTAVDDCKIGFGSSDDLVIYHTGSHAYMTNTTGNWYIQPKSGETAIEIIPDGKVGIRYDNSTKLETTSTGVIITSGDGADTKVKGDFIFAKADETTTRVMWDGSSGSAGKLEFSDDVVAEFGDGGDLALYHDGTNSRINNTSSNDFYFDTGGDFYLRNTNTEKYIKCEADGKVYLYYNNSAKLFTQSWGAQCSGNFLPDGDNTHNLGASGERWANVYSADIHLNNTGAGGNEVDGSEGSWTIQEGANDLFLLNRTNGKKYKFNLTEIS